MTSSGLSNENGIYWLFQNPPAVVKLVMESICVMLGLKPERKPDPSGSGKMIEDFWGTSQKVLGDLKFLDKLKQYDKDNIAPPVIKRIREKWVNSFFIQDCDHDFDRHRNE